MTSGKPRRTSIPDYWSQVAKSICGRVQFLTTVCDHSGTRGANDEAWFLSLLRDLLPNRYGVVTGFVVNSHRDGTKEESISNQCDILIVDNEYNAALCVEESFGIYPVEMVLAHIEVTRSLTNEKLKDDLAKIARTRKLADTKAYRGSLPWDEPTSFSERRSAAETFPPRGYIVGFRSTFDDSTLQSEVEAIGGRYRPNLIFSFDHGEKSQAPTPSLFCRNIPTSRFHKTEDSPLLKFLTALRQHLDTFPRLEIDLNAYLKQGDVPYVESPLYRPSASTTAKDAEDAAPLMAMTADASGGGSLPIEVTKAAFQNKVYNLAMMV